MLMLISCGSDKSHDPILGSWSEINSETKDSASVKKVYFFSKESGAKFIAENWRDKPIKGTWEKDNNQLILSFVEQETYFVDSIMVTQGPDGKVSADYFQKNILKTQVKPKSLKAVPSQYKVRIDVLSNSELKFKFDQKAHHYIKIKQETLSVSFWSILRGGFGIMGLLFITFLFSNQKKKIDWKLIAKGMALQIIIAILVLKVPFVEGAFHWVSGKFVQLIAYTNDGIDFLFGEFGAGQKLQSSWANFAITVLPTIIFFSALMSVLYYLGVLQVVVFMFAFIMKKFMRLSGAESLAAAGNVFLGQTESPLLVKPYLLGMTKSEVMCLMTGGMATIAGGVLAAYVNFLGGDDPVQQVFFAKHLLTASIISAPAAIVAAKILVPETEEINENLEIDKQKIGTNILEAISNGTTDGLKLAVNVGAMLLVFVALMALCNGILDGIGGVTGLNEIIARNTAYGGLSLQFILGYIGAPIVWLIGVDYNEIVSVGELLGQKTVLNEFIAYPRLNEMKESGMLSEKAIIISTYMLCGFANFASIGIQIGGIGALVPSRKGLLSKLGMKALLGGTIASLLTAAIVGMFY